MSDLLLIDGSYGEGGGQILRTTIALSAVMGRPVKIINIRSKRRNPGLRNQHITAVRAVAQLSSASAQGLELGSTTLIFNPGILRGGEYRFDVGTAGSITLVLQALLPLLPYLPEPTRILVSGGTDVPWSPTIDYFRNVVTHFLDRMGFKLKINLLRRGHYPRGGGVVEVIVDDPPGYLKPLNVIERGSIRFLEGISHSRRLPVHIAERQARSAEKAIREKMPGLPVRIQVDTRDSGELGPGSGVAIWVVCEKSVLGSDSLGRRGKPAETVGREAAASLIEDLGTGMALDRHMSDMIIPLIALSEGESMVGGSRLTSHAITNIHVVEKLLGVKAFVEGSPEAPFKLRLKGVGFRL